MKIANFLLSLFSEIATLIVGADKVPFNAHKRMLCDASPFFQAGCKPEWLKDNIITLPDDSPEAAQVMLYWIYHHKLGVPKRLFHGPKSLDIGDGLETAPGLLVKVFILREKYQMPKLRNDSLDTFRYWCGEHEENAKVPGKVIKYAFDNIPDTSHSKLCRLLLIIASSSFSSSDFTLLKDALSFEFFFQLTSLLSELIQNEAEIDLIDPGVWCPMFHTHGAGHPLCADVKDYTLVSEDDE
jgi:hypothetical protein